LIESNQLMQDNLLTFLKINNSW